MMTVLKIEKIRYKNVFKIQVLLQINIHHFIKKENTGCFIKKAT